MGEFFRGWRRKVGCVVMVMAIVPAGMWMRTTFAVDHMRLSIGNRSHTLLSSQGCFVWMSYDASPSPFGWGSDDISDTRVPPSELVKLWRNALSALKVRIWYLPYMYSAIPLTLLSAYLILWKPRKSGRLVNSAPPNF